jgi:predicted RNase H-like HicB family nuclease
VNPLYTAYIRKDGDWYIACHPTIEGAHGIGRTLEESLESLKATLDLIVSSDRALGAIGNRNREIH